MPLSIRQRCSLQLPHPFLRGNSRAFATLDRRYPARLRREASQRRFSRESDRGLSGRGPFPQCGLRPRTQECDRTREQEARAAITVTPSLSLRVLSNKRLKLAARV